MSEGKGGSAHGRPAPTFRVGKDWMGWQDYVSHPNAPAGAAGGGHFSRFPMRAEPDSDIGDPWSPKGQAAADEVEPAPSPANPPPPTQPRALPELKKLENSLMAVHVKAEIVADGRTTNGSGAVTSFSWVGFQSPGWQADSKGKITSFTGKFVCKGTVEIQTKYAPGATPSALSCYGRGTTAEDVRRRDVTLGFHEHCHQEDFIRFMKNSPFPKPPALSIGMTVEEYRSSIERFGKELPAYQLNMEQDSERRTDNVGFGKARASTGSCFAHKVP